MLFAKTILVLLTVASLIKHIVTHEKFSVASIIISKIKELLSPELRDKASYKKIRFLASLFAWGIFFLIFGVLNFFLEKEKNSCFVFSPFREVSFTKLFILLKFTLFYSVCSLIIACFLYLIRNFINSQKTSERFNKNFQIEIDIIALLSALLVFLPRKFFMIIRARYLYTSLSISDMLIFFFLMVSILLLIFYEAFSVSQSRQRRFFIPATIFSAIILYFAGYGIIENVSFNAPENKDKKIILLITGENISPKKMIFYENQKQDLRGWGTYVFREAITPSTNLTDNINSIMSAKYAVRSDATNISALKRNGYEILFISFRDMIEPSDELTTFFDLSLLPPFKRGVVPTEGFKDSFRYLSNLVIDGINKNHSSNIFVWVHYPPLLYNKKGDFAENNKEYTKALENEIIYLLESLKQSNTNSSKIRVAFTSLDGDLPDKTGELTYSYVNVPFVLFELGKTGRIFEDFPFSVSSIFNVLTASDINLLINSGSISKTVYSWHCFFSDNNKKQVAKINFAIFDGKYFLTSSKSAGNPLMIIDTDSGNALTNEEVQTNARITILTENLNLWKDSQIAGQVVKKYGTSQSKKYKYGGMLQAK